MPLRCIPSRCSPKFPPSFVLSFAREPIAAQKVWDDEWNRKYDPEPPVPEQVLFGDFVKAVYLPWSKIHKGSYDDDVRITSILTAFFKGKNLRDIKPAMIEQFKARRI